MRTLLIVLIAALAPFAGAAEEQIYKLDAAYYLVYGLVMPNDDGTMKPIAIEEPPQGLTIDVSAMTVDSTDPTIEVSLLAKPSIIAALGTPARIEMAQQKTIPYMECIDAKKGTFQLNWQALNNVLALDVTVSTAGEKEIRFDGTVTVDYLAGRESVEEVPLPIGKPVFAKLNTEFTAQCAIGALTAAAIPVGETGAYLICLLKPTPGQPGQPAAGDDKYTIRTRVCPMGSAVWSTMLADLEHAGCDCADELAALAEAPANMFLEEKGTGIALSSQSPDAIVLLKNAYADRIASYVDIPESAKIKFEDVVAYDGAYPNARVYDRDGTGSHVQGDEFSPYDWSKDKAFWQAMETDEAGAPKPILVTKKWKDIPGESPAQPTGYFFAYKLERTQTGADEFILGRYFRALIHTDRTPSKRSKQKHFTGYLLHDGVSRLPVVPGMTGVTVLHPEEPELFFVVLTTIEKS